MRVQSVVQELRGEKIDIIPWTEDQVQFVRNALSPAKAARVYMNEEEKTMQVVVPNDQLSLAIGKRGQNVRLAAKLTHWKIDIMSEEEADADGERLEALRRAELAFSLPLRSEAADTDEAGADVEAGMDPDAAVETATSASASDGFDDDHDGLEAVDGAEHNDMAEGDVDDVQAVAEPAALPVEQTVSVPPTDTADDTLLDRDDPDRKEASES